LRSKDPVRVLQTQIEKQPGGYTCSIPEIDYIVDVALGLVGVMGAQISGVGLGGCVMIMVEEDVVDALVAKLESMYYKPKGLETDLTVFIPVKGSEILELDAWHRFTRREWNTYSRTLILSKSIEEEALLF
jgi:galactokinase